jgi:hypothetical protein
MDEQRPGRKIGDGMTEMPEDRHIHVVSLGLKRLFNVRHFSLRALLILVTCVAIVFGYIGSTRYEVSRQMSAIKQIEHLGGMPQTTAIGASDDLPHWILGADSCTYVWLIRIPNASANSIQKMIPYIKRLRLKSGTKINLDIGGNPNVDAELKKYLASELSQCVLLPPDLTQRTSYF